MYSVTISVAAVQRQATVWHLCAFIDQKAGSCLPSGEGEALTLFWLRKTSYRLAFQKRLLGVDFSVDDEDKSEAFRIALNELSCRPACIAIVSGKSEWNAADAFYDRTDMVARLHFLGFTDERLNYIYISQGVTADEPYPLWQCHESLAFLLQSL